MSRRRGKIFVEASSSLDSLEESSVSSSLDSSEESSASSPLDLECAGFEGALVGGMVTLVSGRVGMATVSQNQTARHILLLVQDARLGWVRGRP